MFRQPDRTVQGAGFCTYSKGGSDWWWVAPIQHPISYQKVGTGATFVEKGVHTILRTDPGKGESGKDSRLSDEAAQTKGLRAEVVWRDNLETESNNQVIWRTDAQAIYLSVKISFLIATF